MRDHPFAVLGALLVLALGVWVASMVVSIPATTSTLSENEVMPGVVAGVVDGDTIDMDDGTTVRLLGVDAPEVHGGEECGGGAAKARLAELLPPGTFVDVEEHGTDRYGRTLAWVFVNSTNVSEVMVTEGMGPVYRTSDGGYADAAGSEYLADMLEAETAAQAAGAGWWRRVPPMTDDERATSNR